MLEGDFDRAEERLTEQLRSGPGDVKLYLALAHLYRQRAEIGRAIQIHQNVLLRRDLAADDRRAALAGLAADFRDGGFERRAIQAYEDLLSADPRHRGALRALVALRAQDGNYSAAIGAARRLTRLEKSKHENEESEVLLRMARRAQAEGRSEEALKALKQVLRMHPTHPGVHLLRGEMAAERGRNRAALAAWKKAATLFGANPPPELFPRIQAAFAALGRARGYEEFLREFLDRQLEAPAARIALAGVLVVRGAVDEGVALLHRLLDAHPENLEARVALGSILLAEHRETDAAKEFGQLIEVLQKQPAIDSGSGGGAR